MNLEQARAAGRDGAGLTVAVIDTGVDPENPILKDVLLPGDDLTRNQPGASEWGDLVQSTAAILDSHECEAHDPFTTAEDGTVTQSTAAILDSACVPGILTQSTAAILDSDSITELASAPPLPAAFGHGTMVAGLIHAVAPRARILPLKAFSADGTGRSSDIAQAIYYAVLGGARVINLSFTFKSVSQEVMYATAFAALEGRIVVASAGNEGLAAKRWPAEHKWVVGVGATTLWDTRAPFSNQGYDTFKIGAPGVNLVTTFPGGSERLRLRHVVQRAAGGGGGRPHGDGRAAPRMGRDVRCREARPIRRDLGRRAQRGQQVPAAPHRAACARPGSAPPTQLREADQQRQVRNTTWLP